jgi:hypothetical protein
MPSTMPQACSVEKHHSNCTKVNSRYTMPNQHPGATQTFTLAMTAHYYNCVYILAQSPPPTAHVAIKNTSVHKI